MASYSTPPVFLHAMVGLYGRERFLDAYRSYARTWAFKHPYPWDLFHHFEAALGEDLDHYLPDVDLTNNAVDLAAPAAPDSTPDSGG